MSDDADFPTLESVSYLGVDEADTLATLVAGLTSWAAATETAKGQALAQASLDVDTAMPYQGRPLYAAQTLQFPRVPYESEAGAGGAPTADAIWDWDAATARAVVPLDVKLAVLHQADTLLTGTREARLSAQHDGVVYELTGQLAESYKQNNGPGVISGLSRRAWMLMRRYRVRGGRLL